MNHPYPVRRVYAVHKHSAKKRKLAWKLTLDDFAQIIFRPCQYCGKPPGQRIYVPVHCTDKNRGFMMNGIDRVNNKRGYVKGNVVACCGWCNQAKSDKTLDEFYAWIRNIWRGWGSLHKTQRSQRRKPQRS